MRAALLLAAALVVAGPLRADSGMPAARWADTALPDARQEAAARALMATIRCLVCQGQAISDSDADLAGDMRGMIRERIAAGEPPAAIRAWLVRRYGAWVSYAPPVEPLTWPLWIAPVLLVGAGLLVARTSFGRRR